MVDLIIGRRRREAWGLEVQADEALDTTPLHLTLIRPAISRNNILLIGGVHDLVCPMKPIDDLWQVWGQPDLWRLPHGHISFMSQRSLTARVLDWLTSRLIGSSGPVKPNNARPTLCTGRPDGVLLPSRTSPVGRQ